MNLKEFNESKFDLFDERYDNKNIDATYWDYQKL